tara:strand:+ start:428 stop:829 length:402 start_codon:yes stop_codon:yes gene_type:complete
MDSFEINKIVAAVLLVALLVIGIGKISNLLFNVEKPEVSGYKVEVSEEVSKKSVAQKEESVEVDISALMAQADLAHGEKIFKKCSACHSYKQVGETKLDQLYTMLWEEKLLQSKITNIQKHLLLIQKIGLLKN